MSEASENIGSDGNRSIDGVISDYISGLTDEHKMLVALKAQLYDGSWIPMLDDLENRLKGKPYIFKLANRIKDDVDRINAMKEFECEHHVDLADYVELS